MAKHIMCLTGRHPFPENEGPLFPEDIELIRDALNYTEAHELYEKMAENIIPKDTTTLVVYMSGLKILHSALAAVCSRRCITLVTKWYQGEGDPKDSGSYGNRTKDPTRQYAY